MFALMDMIDEDVRINLKCEPHRAEELRESFDFIIPGYHMSKKHWNTILCNNSPIDWLFLKDLIDHSYHMVFLSLPKKFRATDS